MFDIKITRFIGRWFIRGFVFSLAFVLIVLAALRWTAHQREYLPFAVGLPEEGRLIETPEGSIFILEVGEAGLPRVLFAHGTAAWSGIWWETLNELAKSNYLATAFDMPPFGWSEYPPVADYSRSAQAKRVIALLESLGDRPIVVAHSVGAGAVSEAVLQRPDLVSGFVLVAGAIGLGNQSNPKYPRNILRISTLRIYLTAATATNPLLTGKFLRNFMYRKEAATPKIITMLQEPMVRKGYTGSVADWVPELFTSPSTSLSLDPKHWNALDLPVSLIWGNKDNITPVDQGRELASLIQNSKLTVLEDVGHVPHLEAPSEFMTELIRELKKMSQQSVYKF